MMRLLILIAICMSQAAIAAEPIGRLFTSPAERSNLDYLRQTRKPNQIKVETPSETEIVKSTPIELPDAINLQGYVKRNDGKQGTVWVNNQALQENSGNKEVVVGKLPEASNRIPLKLHANGRQLTLKAGQVYDPETNRVREARNHGAQGDSGTIGD